MSVLAAMLTVIAPASCLGLFIEIDGRRVFVLG